MIGNFRFSFKKMNTINKKKNAKLKKIYWDFRGENKVRFKKIHSDSLNCDFDFLQFISFIFIGIKSERQIPLK